MWFVGAYHHPHENAQNAQEKLQTSCGILTDHTTLLTTLLRALWRDEAGKTNGEWGIWEWLNGESEYLRRILAHPWKWRSTYGAICIPPAGTAMQVWTCKSMRKEDSSYHHLSATLSPCKAMQVHAQLAQVVHTYHWSSATVLTVFACAFSHSPPPSEARITPRDS